MSEVHRKDSVNNDIFVSASAGTGKTYMLVKHYIEIFDNAFRKNENIDVHNVVAITFTKKAAKEMKDRVLNAFEDRLKKGCPGKWKSIRARIIYSWISTIHSFCERILRESAVFLGIDPGFEVLSGMKKTAIENRVVMRYFEENIDDMEELIDYLGVDNTFKLLKNVLSSKRYEITSSRPLKTNIKEMEIGEKGKKILQGTRVFHSKFEGLLKLYEEETTGKGYIDFEDLLIKTRDLLKEFPAIRKKYIRRFRYILVDEFQDTNELQKEIIDLLHTKEENYLFFVGDNKQSIYRFRGADVSVFNKTREHFYQKGSNITQLTTNRRSHPDIVEFQNRLFGKVMNPQHAEKLFYSTYETTINPLPYESADNASRVRVLFSENTSVEPLRIAKCITDLLNEEVTFRDKNGNYEKRRIRPGDIAILFRKSGKVKLYEEQLEKYSIPYYTVSGKNFYDSPEVAALLACLDIIVDPLDDNSFAKFLLSPAIGLTLDEIVALKGKNDHFYQSINRSQNITVQKLKTLFDRYMRLKFVLSPGNLLEKFVSETDYLAKLSSLDNSQRMIANVEKLLEISKELDRMGTTLRELSSNLKSFVDSTEETEATLETEQSNSVKLLTVHKSKGLEFPIVLLADCFWQEKNSTDPEFLFGENGYMITEKMSSSNDETVISNLVRDELEKEREEEKRTLYVATSRPREMLILSLNGKPTSRRPWSQMFLETLINYDEKELQISSNMSDLVEEIDPSGEFKEYLSKDTVEPPSEFDIELIKNLDSSTYSEYISPTALQEEVNFDFHDNGEPAEFKRDPKELGTLAHSFLEQVGVKGTTLKSLIQGGDPVAVDRIRFFEDDLKTVKNVLEKNIENHLIKEIEQSKNVINENMFQKEFRKYILVGIIDKLYLTQEGWKIADFKYAHYDKKTLTKYTFQMQFYYYILKELLNPVEINLLYLKDGKTVSVKPAENFEKQLVEALEQCEKKVFK
ncbi:MAG: UvrD-helicase domain-containing protein [Thermotogota bacterium]|nr:UvrD-helicase domain-containing protein [Thermotogota bacterium]